jgi:hypothetical protein
MTAALFDPASHEQVTTAEWDEGLIRASVAGIVAEAEEQFDRETWPVHPLDEAYSGTDIYATHGLWAGAAGVVWALHALEREQVERGRGMRGRGRFSLWTGDLGAALFGWQCITGDASFPTIDWW